MYPSKASAMFAVQGEYATRVHKNLVGSRTNKGWAWLSFHPKKYIYN